MAIIETAVGNVQVARVPPEQVLGLPESGASSRGSTFWRRVLTCPREHFLANKLKWAPKQRSKPLDFGLVWHHLLETYYGAIQRQQQKTAAASEEDPTTQAFRELEKFSNADGWDEGYETMTRMLTSYFELYDKDDRNKWEIVGIENLLEVGLDAGTGFEYSSRLDLTIVDHSYNDRVLRHVEHKSASTLDANTVSGYTQDLQVLGQVWLQTTVPSALDLPYLGAVVNISTKAKTTKHGRFPAQPSEAQLEAWAASMQFWQRYAWMLESQNFPQNTAHCVRKYGRCSYFDLCQSQPSAGPEQLVQITKKHLAGEGPLAPGFKVAQRFDIEELG